MRNLGHTIAWARAQSWAILPGYAETIMSVLERRAGGVRLSSGELTELIGERQAASQLQRSSAAQASRGGIAVIPIVGPISARAGMIEDASGMTSHEAISAALAAADADASVGTIVLDLNSPGGTVAGTPELAARLRAMSKPVIAQVNYMAASAAYWLAAQADEIVVSPSGEVGSIGVVQAHEDVSAAAAADGVKVSFITAGKHKAEGNRFEPLSEDARAYAQQQVDTAYGMFVADIAKGRGVSKATASGASFGEGRMLGARAALDAGMVDRIATMDETLTRLQSGGRVKRRMRAETSDAPLMAEIAPVVNVDTTAIAPGSVVVTTTPETATEPNNDKANEVDLDLADLDLI